MLVHQTDSPGEIADPFAVSTQSAQVETPLEFAPHAHCLHTLVWIRGGVMTVDLGERIVTIPEGQGLWIPAGVVHAGRTTAGSLLCDAVFDIERSPISFRAPTAVDITPVLGGLLEHLERSDLAPAARLRAEAVVFDVLETSPVQFSLVVPELEPVKTVVSALVDNPADRRTLAEWGLVARVSERTLARLFRIHTGLTFNQWRQALRVHRALALMADGHTVQDVSDELGYAQASTFIASFKRVVGTTPGAMNRAAGV